MTVTGSSGKCDGDAAGWREQLRGDARHLSVELLPDGEFRDLRESAGERGLRRPGPVCDIPVGRRTGAEWGDHRGGDLVVVQGKLLRFHVPGDTDAAGLERGPGHVERVADRAAMVGGRRQRCGHGLRCGGGRRDGDGGLGAAVVDGGRDDRGEGDGGRAAEQWLAAAGSERERKWEAVLVERVCSRSDTAAQVGGSVREWGGEHCADGIADESGEWNERSGAGERGGECECE